VPTALRAGLKEM